VRRTGPVLAGMLASVGMVAPSPGHVDGNRLKGLLLGLAAFGRDPDGGVTRLGFSAADRSARAWVIEPDLERATIDDMAARIRARAEAIGRETGVAVSEGSSP